MLFEFLGAGPQQLCQRPYRSLGRRPAIQVAVEERAGITRVSGYRLDRRAHHESERIPKNCRGVHVSIIAYINSLRKNPSRYEFLDTDFNLIGVGGVTKAGTPRRSPLSCRFLPGFNQIGARHF